MSFPSNIPSLTPFVFTFVRPFFSHRFVSCFSHPKHTSKVSLSLPCSPDVLDFVDCSYDAVNSVPCSRSGVSSIRRLFFFWCHHSVGLFSYYYSPRPQLSSWFSRRSISLSVLCVCCFRRLFSDDVVASSRAQFFFNAVALFLVRLWFFSLRDNFSSDIVRFVPSASVVKRLLLGCFVSRWRQNGFLLKISDPNILHIYIYPPPLPTYLPPYLPPSLPPSSQFHYIQGPIGDSHSSFTRYQSPPPTPPALVCNYIQLYYSISPYSITLRRAPHELRKVG